MRKLLDRWDDFFYGRIGYEGCCFAGWLRVCFALLFVADRLLLTVDLHMLLSPSHGLVPFWLGRENQDVIEPNMHTIFELAPESDSFLWFVHLIGILQGVLLLLGVVPRLQLIGCYINLVSFQHHNQVIWDGEDMMFKVFCMNFMLMPLHRTTIYDCFGFRRSGHTDDSWAMWPIRLFQIEVMFVYIGASLGKLSGNAWLSGFAVYFITYSKDFYPGLCNPDFIFDRIGPLKLMTWASLVIEITSWSLVWVPSLRIPIVFNMILFHIGIEITMNMHCFELLSITGWLTFMLQPDFRRFESTKRSSTRFIADALILFFIMWAFIYQVPEIDEVVPKSIAPFFKEVGDIQQATKRRLNPILNPVGAYMNPFSMYDGGWGWASFEYHTEMVMLDGSEHEWHSPRWINMTFVERKRYMRLMNYYSTLEQGNAGLRVHLLRSLANSLESQYGGFERITLFETVEIAPDPKEGAGWFDPVRSNTHTVESAVLTLYPPPPCQDHSPQCLELRGRPCDPRSEAACPVSCGSCEDGVFDDRDYMWEFHDFDGEDEEWDDVAGTAAGGTDDSIQEEL